MTLKKYLEQFSKEQLIAQIIELNKKYKDVKGYYEFSINPDSNAKKEQVKEFISECFYPKRGDRFRFTDAKQAIKEFKKLEPAPDALADVMIHFVEMGVSFTNDYGDIDDPFYESIEKHYNDACLLIHENKLITTFKERCLKIVSDTSGIGWGFHDVLNDVFYNYFSL